MQKKSDSYSIHLTLLSFLACGIHFDSDSEIIFIFNPTNNKKLCFQKMNLENMPRCIEE